MKKNRFWILLSSYTFSHFGDWFSLTVLMIILSNSPTAVAILLVCRALPYIVATFWAGPLSDRFDRKKIIILTNLLQGITILILVFDRSLPTIYTTAIILSVLRAFFEPAIGSYLPAVVQPSNLAGANGMLTMGSMFAMAFGPALGSFVLKTAGSAFVFLIDSVTFFIFVFAAYFIKGKSSPQGTLSSKTAWKDALDGAREIFKMKSFLPLLLSVSCVYFTMGGLGTLELFFVKQSLNINVEDYGFVVTIAGIGAIFGSWISGKLSERLSLRWYSMGVILFGAGIVFFSLQRLFYAAIPFLLIEGIGESFFTVHGKSFFQKNAPHSHLGKAMSFLGLATQMGMTIGMLVSGLLAEYFSAALLLFTCGLIAILASSLPLLPHRRKDLR